MAHWKLTRPTQAPDPQSGLLLSEHFQIAYVTNDFDRACALFGEQLGIRDYAKMKGQLTAGGEIQAAFAWVGSVMYELICATGPGSALYNDLLPTGDDFAVRQHHLGFLIHDQAQWDAVIANAERNGWAIPYRNVNPFVEVAFVAVPHLPHYLEYLFATPTGLAYFENVPRH